MDTEKQLSKHLQECLDHIQTVAQPFGAIDLFPKIKRADWVIGKLIEAGRVERVGNGSFKILKTTTNEQR